MNEELAELTQDIQAQSAESKWVRRGNKKKDKRLEAKDEPIAAMGDLLVVEIPEVAVVARAARTRGVGPGTPPFVPHGE